VVTLSHRHALSWHTQTPHHLSKALRRAIIDVFDNPVLQRCQLHYADVVVMPTLERKPLAGAVIGLAKSE
jgi:hypothetical protein